MQPHAFCLLARVNVLCPVASRMKAVSQVGLYGSSMKISVLGPRSSDTRAFQQLLCLLLQVEPFGLVSLLLCNLKLS